MNAVILRAIYTAFPRGGNKQPHIFIKVDKKDVKIKSALVITIKVKKIIAPKFPATSNPLSLLRSGCKLGSEKKPLLSAKEKYVNDFEGLTLQSLVEGILLY